MRGQLADLHAPGEADVPHSARVESGEWVLEIELDGSLHRIRRGALRRRAGALAFFDGVLHDRDDLARELDESADDTGALVLAAYVRWGGALLQRLRGCYALAIIDGMERVAFVARDPLGTHPLFYARRGRTILFATTPRALLAEPGISRDLNRAALADRICLRWPDPGETYFAAVRRVPPGTRVEIRSGLVSFKRYWDPLPPDEPVTWLSDDEAHRFGDVLNRAVDRALQTGPTGVLLSGGLDSISVAAVASDRARALGTTAPIALSLGFPDPACDERDIQRAVALRLGLEHVLIDFEEAAGRRGLLNEALDLNRDLPSPLLNTWSPAYLALIRRGQLAAGLRSVLTGSGGDEWLAVTPYAVAEYVRRGDIRGLQRFLGAWRRSYRLSTWRFVQSAVWTFGLRPLAGMAADQLAPKLHAANRARRVTSADPEWIAPDPGLRAEQVRRAPATLGEARPAQGFYLREVRTGLDHALAAQELEEQYELGRRYGVLYQQPYWDPDVVDVLYRLPPDTLNRGGRSKGLVRDTVARRFPDLGLQSQQKVAATNFYRTLVHAEGPAVHRRLGNFSALGALGVVDARRLDESVRSMADGPGHLLYRLWDLLNLEGWVRSQLAAT